MHVPRSSAWATIVNDHKERPSLAGRTPLLTPNTTFDSTAGSHALVAGAVRRAQRGFGCSTGRAVEAGAREPSFADQVDARLDTLRRVGSMCPFHMLTSNGAGA